MTAPARTAAYHAVRAIADGRSDLPVALHASREHLEDERDRSLAAEIVTGTLRWQRSLDHLIEHFSRRRIAKLDAEVVAILRLSLYQFLHLDRVPASAGSLGNHFSATCIEVWASTKPCGSGILRWIREGEVSAKGEIVTEPTVLPSL